MMFHNLRENYRGGLAPRSPDASKFFSPLPVLSILYCVLYMVKGQSKPEILLKFRYHKNVLSLLIC